MRLTWRDGLATLLVAATGVLYGFYVVLGSVGPSWIGIQDPTGLAFVGLGIGVIISALALDITAGTSAGFRIVVSVVRLGSLALGLLALFGENVFTNAVWETVLAAFMGSVALVWAIGIARHAGLIGAGGGTGATTRLNPV